MLYLTCTMISSIDLEHYEVSRAKDWVSVNRGTNLIVFMVSICGKGQTQIRLSSAQNPSGTFRWTDG